MAKTEQGERPLITYGRKTRKLTKADLVRVNLPRKFWKSKSDLIQDDDVREKVMAFRKDIDRHIDSGHGIVFAGEPGVGKTSAAACVLKQAIVRGYTTYYVTHDEARELVFDAGRLYGDGTDGTTIRQQIDRAQLLILDGFNAQFLTDKAFGPLQLERLLNKRSAAVKSTILTTRVAGTLKRKEYENLFDVVTSCMALMKIQGRNLRDDAREALMKEVHGEDS